MSPVLYTYAASVWGAAAELAVIELGHSDVEIKSVDLVEGENFQAHFIALNPAASIPTFETGDGKVLTNTTDVVAHLIEKKGGKLAADKSFIAVVHEDKIDPNFALLSARTKEELQAKGADLPGKFVSHRQIALEKYSVLPEAAPHKAFYDQKLAANGGLNKIYNGEAPADDFFKASQAHYENIRKFINEVLPPQLPDSGFIAGAEPGEVDFHVGAWLARIAAVAGAVKTEDGLTKLKAYIDGPVPEKVTEYWNTWSARKSWKEVYAAFLH